MKQNKVKNLKKAAAGVLAAALAVTAVSADMPAAAKAAVRENAAGTAGMNEQPGSGLLAAENVTVDTVITPVVRHQDAGIKSVVKKLQQYDWDCYSNDYYYSRMTEKQRQLYERLDAACGEFMNGNVDAGYYSVTREGESEKATVRGIGMQSSLGLSQDEVIMVTTAFVYSNPQYYFLNTTRLFDKNNSSCALGVYDDFAEGAVRAVETEKVAARLAELQDQIDALKMSDPSNVQYQLETDIHTLICDTLDYMHDYDTPTDDPLYTQTIYGALMTDKSLCAGYAKLYQLLCNYYHIECVAVTSETHAWNIVRYGDSWYMVDVTWADTGSDRMKYYHLSYNEMLLKDSERSHVPLQAWNDILPETKTLFNTALETMEMHELPDVDIKDTAAGVMISFTPDAGDVYYTLDGTAPTADDLYQEPIELNESGTYVVTAMQDSNDMLSSAYEIFTVRVANGKPKISSIANASGKKIKVKYTSAKTYAGYEISYSSKKDFSNQKTSKVGPNTKSVTIQKLKKNQTYYVRVRGYKTDAYGNYYYTPYSGVKKIKITK